MAMDNTPTATSPTVTDNPRGRTATADAERGLATTGRRVRLIAVAIGAILLLAGSIWGSDDDFPFGPFRMYAGVNLPDDDAPDSRVEAVDASGATVLLTEGNTGIRRAEVEGQEDAFVTDPSELQAIVAAYERRNPDRPRITRVSLIVRWHDIENGRITGKWWDDVKATWERPQ